MSDEIGTEIAAIETRMLVDRAGYFADPGAQTRYRELVEARETGGKPAARSADERAEIERVMRTDRGRYFGDQAMQERYRAILGGDPVADDAAALAEGLEPPMTVDEWAAVGMPRSSYEGYVAIAEAANAVLGEIEERGIVAESFHRLPQAVQEAGFKALVAPVAASPVPAADLAAFARVCPDVAADWSDDGAAMLGRARARLWAALDGLSDREAVVALRWLDRLSAPAQSALIRHFGKG